MLITFVNAARVVAGTMGNFPKIIFHDFVPKLCDDKINKGGKSASTLKLME